MWPFVGIAQGGGMDPNVAIAHRGSKDPFPAPPIAQNRGEGSVDPPPSNKVVILPPVAAVFIKGG